MALAQRTVLVLGCCGGSVRRGGSAVSVCDPTGKSVTFSVNLTRQNRGQKQTWENAQIISWQKESRVDLQQGFWQRNHQASPLKKKTHYHDQTDASKKPDEEDGKGQSFRSWVERKEISQSIRSLDDSGIFQSMFLGRLPAWRGGVLNSQENLKTLQKMKRWQVLEGSGVQKCSINPTRVSPGEIISHFCNAGMLKSWSWYNKVWAPRTIGAVDCQTFLEVWLLFTGELQPKALKKLLAYCRIHSKFTLSSNYFWFAVHSWNCRYSLSQMDSHLD